MTDPFWWRCSCHHPGRRCFYRCPADAEVVRDSDGRPVCRSCADCDPGDSAGFGVAEGVIERLSAATT